MMTPVIPVVPVIPAKAGIPTEKRTNNHGIPAYAGMTMPGMTDKKQTTMKQTTLIGFLCLTTFFACEDMLKTDTNHYLSTEGHELNSSNDTLYSMVGILRKVQAIADRYVLVGELRGELLDITENADLDLQAIYNFDFGLTTDNPYIDTKAYYDIINNCNFFVQRADTSARTAGKQIMIKEVAAVKSIRAWVYMQLILNYGKACYYTDPILTVEDMNKIKSDPSAWISGLDVLFDRESESLREAMAIQKSMGNPLYEDLLYGELAFIPATLVLGDLCLYTGQPASAAALYYDYIYSNRVFLARRYLRWMDAGFLNYGGSYSQGDIITAIYTTTENETGSYLTGWCYPAEWNNMTGINCTYQLKPSNASINIWDRQDYAYLPEDATSLDEVTYTTGDLRGTVKIEDSDYGVYTATTSPPYWGGNLLQSYFRFVTAESDTLPFIAKYGIRDGNNAANISYVYRAGAVYLRYAEALNRLGKSTLAFAILKYGATNTVFNNPAYVNPAETNPLPAYCYFPDALFLAGNASNNRGMHSRGSGWSNRNEYYVIPAGVDTVRFVDEKICDEMAMETAFEGNRFHDLMRFARYYGNEFLATRVANCRGVEDAALKAKLMNEQNWHIPHN